MISSSPNKQPNVITWMPLFVSENVRRRTNVWLHHDGMASYVRYTSFHSTRICSRTTTCLLHCSRSSHCVRTDCTMNNLNEIEIAFRLLVSVALFLLIPINFSQPGECDRSTFPIRCEWKNLFLNRSWKERHTDFSFFVLPVIFLSTFEDVCIAYSHKIKSASIHLWTNRRKVLLRRKYFSPGRSMMNQFSINRVKMI